MSPLQLILVAWIAGLLGLGVFVRGWLRQRRLQERIFAADVPDTLVDDDVQGWLSYWLYTAGYRGPNATTLFVLATVVMSVVGIALATFTYLTGAVNLQVQLLSSIPGAVGEVLIPIAYASPFTLAFLCGGAPWLVVRAARRKRVQEFEQDLPLMLDLLSTLASAGLGFDGGLDRVLEVMEPQRALPQEFRMFQRDTLAGRARIDALRRLGRRVNLVWFSAFISAVVQAEQIGAGLAQVLQTQAIDLRDRRREQALAMAMQIPIKLLVPLICCFFPGLMTAIAGPVFYGLFQMFDSIARNVGNS